MKHCKRILSLALVLVLLLGLLPTVALAARSASGLTRSGTVTVRFNAHGHGEAPEALELPADSSLWEYFGDSCWEALSIPDTDGMIFWGWRENASDGLGETFDFYQSLSEDTTLYAVWLGRIDSLDLWVDPPAPGSATQPIAHTERYTDCEVSSIGWFNTPDGYYTRDRAETLEPGGTYYGVVLIDPERRSLFAETGEVVQVHGASKVSEELSDTVLILTFSVTIPASGTVDCAAIWADTPIPGSPLSMAPGYDCLTPGVTLYPGDWWENSGDVGNYSREYTGCFEPGMKLYTYLTLYPDTGMTFSENLQVTVDGAATLVRVVNHGSNAIVVLEVSVWQTYGFTLLTQGHGWYFIDDDPHAGSFIDAGYFPGGPHTLRLLPDPGWHFSGIYDRSGVLISDRSVYSFDLDQTVDYWRIVFEEGTLPVDTVELELPIPCAGEEFNWETDSAGAVVTNGAHVTIKSDRWYNEWGISGNPLPFEEGQNYFVEINLTAEPGYVLTEDTVFRINGEPVVWKQQSNVTTWSISSRNYTMQPAEAIPELDIQLHHIPAAGELFDPDYDVVLASALFAQIEWLSAMWREADAGLETDYPLTFREGEAYYASFVIHGASGWTLTDDTVVTVNGEPAAGWTRVGVGTYRLDSRSYTVREEQIIPTVEVYANKPIYDHAPDEPYVPDYEPYTVEDWTWSDAQGNSLPKDFTVVGGAAYSLTVTLLPKEGYMFSADALSARLFWEAAEIVSVEPHRLTLRAGCVAGMGTPNPFVDVEKGNYYYEPVLWAYYHEPRITSGLDKTHFGPNETCAREQVVTFLWAAFNKPEPASLENPFSDVPDVAWYLKPVLWAKEAKITSGVGGGLFGVGQSCSRAQVVTFLWAAAGKPEPRSAENPFTDVSENDYFYKSVLWAVENGITKGMTPTSFAPQSICTRAQVVTFLYAAYGPKG